MKPLDKKRINTHFILIKITESFFFKQKTTIIAAVT